MSLTMATLRQLGELCRGDVHSRQTADILAQSIPRDELAAWLEKWVSNHAAQQYLTKLFYGPDGVTSGNLKACRRFLRELELRKRSRLARSVIEGGNISEVAEILRSPITGWRNPDTGAPMPVVYKRMPPFLDRADAEAYLTHYTEYNRVLRDEIGITVPHFDARLVEPDSGLIVVYVIQERVDTGSVCHRILHGCDTEAAELLYQHILRQFEKLYRFNSAHGGNGYQIGLDGQIPNWSVAGYSGDPDSLTGDEQLRYLDTNVPMIRVHGQDVISTDMYFQDLPGIARRFIKTWGLDQEVMNRYYQMRIIIVDFLANLIMHRREDLVPRFVELSNQALAGPFAIEGHEPVSVQEVRKYYRTDLALWRLWRSFRLLGVLSDGVSGGDWQSLRHLGEFHSIWTQPMY